MDDKLKDQQQESRGWDQITNNGEKHVPKSGMHRIVVRAVQYFILVFIISMVVLAIVLATR